MGGLTTKLAERYRVATNASLSPLEYFHPMASSDIAMK